MKATYAEIGGKKVNLFKDPKTDTSKLKKSHKGCIVVKEENGKLSATDGYTFEEARSQADNKLVPFFKDGKLLNPDTFIDIRNRLHGGNN